MSVDLEDLEPGKDYELYERQAYGHWRGSLRARFIRLKETPQKTIAYFLPLNPDGSETGHDELTTRSTRDSIQHSWEYKENRARQWKEERERREAEEKPIMERFQVIQDALMEFFDVESSSVHIGYITDEQVKRQDAHISISVSLKRLEQLVSKLK